MRTQAKALPAPEIRASPIRVGMIGTGKMAHYHLTEMLGRPDTVVPAVCEPSPAAYERIKATFLAAGAPVPPNEPDWRRFLDAHGRAGTLDAVVIITPHVLHFEQATAALKAGLDVLLEKPMVLDATQAMELIRTRDRTGRLLVVAFQGSLSPNVRAAARMIRSGELGAVLNVDAVAWQDWQTHAAGTWRQDPAQSGGGFLFDTGAHMLNTVCDLAGEDVTQVAAWLEDDGAPVDIRAVVMARFASGALVTMNACGRSIPSFGSEVRVFCEQATLRTGIWGERLEIQRHGARRLKSRSIGRAALRVATVPRCAGRTRTEPEPARGGAAHGPAVGCDPGIGRARRRGRATRARSGRGLTTRVA